MSTKTPNEPCRNFPSFFSRLFPISFLFRSSDAPSVLHAPVPVLVRDGHGARLEDGLLRVAVALVGPRVPHAAAAAVGARPRLDRLDGVGPQRRHVPQRPHRVVAEPVADPAVPPEVPGAAAAPGARRQPLAVLFVVVVAEQPGGDVVEEAPQRREAGADEEEVGFEAEPLLRTMLVYR